MAGILSQAAVPSALVVGLNKLAEGKKRRRRRSSKKRRRSSKKRK
jgi:hypothetical protein